MTLLVTGGRDLTDRAFVWERLDAIHANTPVTLLLEGGARGVDRLAREWAISRGVAYRTFEADWKKHGRAAGPIRNEAMYVEGKPHQAARFPGNSGTRDCADRAEPHGVPVIDCRPESFNSRWERVIREMEL